MNLFEELKPEERQEILGTLFGFTVEDTTGDGHFVVYDEEGYEFHAADVNLKYTLRTLYSIFEYVKDKSKEEGARKARSDIRTALGL